jgi:archaemetzincin
MPLEKPWNSKKLFSRVPEPVLNTSLGILFMAGAFVWAVMAASPGGPEAMAAGLRSPELPSPADQLHAADAAADRERAERLSALVERLKPLATRLAKPGPSDWLAIYPEKGQTFREYLASDPTRPTEARGTIVIQRLGDLTATERRLVKLTAEAMAVWFNVPTTFSEDLKLDVVPETARRENPYTRQEQLLTSYILDRVLKPRLPQAAVAYLCFTAADLWPGQGWNFVFGQASPEGRVGVWSIARFGDPDKSDESFRLVLLRTLKLATHECGHMFSLAHCTAYECNLNGCNSLDESDRHPLALCPECLAKLCWASRADPAERYRKLVAFCKREGLKPEAEIYEKRLAVIEALRSQKPRGMERITNDEVVRALVPGWKDKYEE